MPDGYHPPMWPGIPGAPLGVMHLAGPGINDEVRLDPIPEAAVPLVMATQEGDWGDVDYRVSKEKRLIVIPRAKDRILVR